MSSMLRLEGDCSFSLGLQLTRRDPHRILSLCLLLPLVVNYSVFFHLYPFRLPSRSSYFSVLRVTVVAVAVSKVDDLTFTFTFLEFVEFVRSLSLSLFASDRLIRLICFSSGSGRFSLSLSATYGSRT